MRACRVQWVLLSVALVVAGLAAPATAATSQWTGPGSAIASTGNRFTSTGSFTINPVGAASPYPSVISVPWNAPITDVRVTVQQLSHVSVTEIDMMLVGPQGQQVMLMSDAGGTNTVTGISLNFSDAAPSTVAAPPVNNADYRPTDNATGDSFPAPAPTNTSGVSLSVFDNTMSAGDWKLYVVDDTGGGGGTIASWSLFLDVAPTPYPSAITVSGLTRVQDLNVTLNGLTHTFPGDVDLLLVGPQGQQATVLSDAGGGLPVSGLTMTFDDQATDSPPAAAQLTGGTWKPVNYGTPADPYPAPAPASTGAAALSVFNGTDPNGVWRLFIVDDAGGDSGGLDSWSLTFDTDQAAPSGSVSINSGAATTAGTAVTLGVSATDPSPGASGVARMRFSNDGTTWSPWQPYAATAAWTLAAGPDGTRTVHAQFDDAAGNISTAVSDTIQLVVPDTTGPTWTRFVPKKKAKKVSRTVTIKVFASEGLNPRTVTGKTVFLKRKGSAKKVKAKVSYHKAKKLIVLDPSVRLAKHKTYRVTITPKVKDPAGNAFDGNTGRTGTQNLRWIFVTR